MTASGNGMLPVSGVPSFTAVGCHGDMVVARIVAEGERGDGSGARLAPRPAPPGWLHCIWKCRKTNRIYPHMLDWREDPSNPDRPILSHLDVQGLAADRAELDRYRPRRGVRPRCAAGAGWSCAAGPSTIHEGGGWKPSRRCDEGSLDWG